MNFESVNRRFHSSTLVRWNSSVGSVVFRDNIFPHSTFLELKKKSFLAWNPCISGLLPAESNKQRDGWLDTELTLGLHRESEGSAGSGREQMTRGSAEARRQKMSKEARTWETPGTELRWGGEKKKKQTYAVCAVYPAAQSYVTKVTWVHKLCCFFFPLVALLVKQFIRHFYQIIGKKNNPPPLLSPNSWGE